MLIYTNLLPFENMTTKLLLMREVATLLEKFMLAAFIHPFFSSIIFILAIS